MGEEKFKVLKGIPVPKVGDRDGRGRKRLYPFEDMEIGDCLRFKAYGSNDPEYKKVYNSAKSHTKRKECGYDFVFARMDDGFFGCWKVSVEKANGAGSAHGHSVPKKKNREKSKS